MLHPTAPSRIAVCGTASRALLFPSPTHTPPLGPPPHPPTHPTDCCAAGYATFGNKVTGNVLQSVPYAVPAIIANAAVLVHVAAAYQASTMPLYHMLDEQAAQVGRGGGGRGGGYRVRQLGDG